MTSWTLYSEKIQVFELSKMVWLVFGFLLFLLFDSLFSACMFVCFFGGGGGGEEELFFLLLFLLFSLEWVESVLKVNNYLEMMHSGFDLNLRVSKLIHLLKSSFLWEPISVAVWRSKWLKMTIRVITPSLILIVSWHSSIFECYM